MAKAKKPQVTRDAIVTALRAATQHFLGAVKRAHPQETLYAFLFEISCEGFSAHGAAATEEAISRYAAAQLKGMKVKAADPLAVAKSCFRWAGPEDGWYQQPDSAFDKVNELLSRAESEGLYDECDGSLNELCLQSLRDLDATGVFGSGEQREQVVLGICYIGGDNSDKEFLAWATQVNSPSVMKRLKKELKQSRKDSELM